MTDKEKIRCLIELLKLIADDWRYYYDRRDNACSENVKTYYENKIYRANKDYARIERRIRKLKAAAQEGTSC